ncbi:MAG: P-loop NTPase, partial [bacterium]|nr:P-loop NTPase [bacterium]
HLTMIQVVPLTGVVMVTTPQAIALADAYKAATMFGMTGVNVPILGVVENMAYFTPAELPENKYYIFGSGGGHSMAKELEVPFLGEVPILMSVREGGDQGKPGAVDAGLVQTVFVQIAEKVAQQIALLNANLVVAPSA